MTRKVESRTWSPEIQIFIGLPETGAESKRSGETWQSAETLSASMLVSGEVMMNEGSSRGD